MVGVNLYINSEDYELYKKLDKGEASRIFSQALKEHFSVMDNLELIESKIKLLQSEENKILERIELLRQRKGILEFKKEKEEVRKQEIELKQKKKEEEEEIRLKERSRKRDLFMFKELTGLSDKEIIHLVDDWSKNYKRKEILKYLNNHNIKIIKDWRKVLDETFAIQ